MHRHGNVIALLALPLALVLTNVVSCTGSEDTGNTTGTAGTTAAAAGTTAAAAGTTAAAAGTTAAAAGTNGGAAGTTANTAGTSGGAAGTTAAAGTNGGTAGTKGNTAGTTGGTAGTTGGTAGTTGGTAGTTGGAALSYKTDIEPIVLVKCTPCHITETDGQLSMKMNMGYASLVTNGAAKTDLNCTMLLAANKKRVVPGDPDHSYMYIKISHTDAELSGPKCGPAMPETKSGMTLTAEQKTKIHDWIMGGANP